jgi:hypothetical protein
MGSEVQLRIDPLLLGYGAETLHKELEGRLRGGSESGGSFFCTGSRAAGHQGCRPAQAWRPISLRRCESGPQGPPDDILVSLALVRAELNCASSPRKQRPLAQRPVPGAALRYSLAGFALGLSLPFLAEVDPAFSASLVASGSGALIARPARRQGAHLPVRRVPGRMGRTAGDRSRPVPRWDGLDRFDGPWAGDALGRRTRGIE